MMFSSNPFPHLTSSIQVFPPSSSFLDNEKDDLYIYQQDQGNNPFLPGDCFPSREKFSTSKHDLLEELGLEENNEYTLISGSGTKKNHTSKKDHHSKIHTSQGPRNRRVRLSIEVAKKFFYLQDLQGFDKASKTLDWLFKQSKIPIDELVKMKKQSSSSTVSDHSEVVFAENFKGLGEEDKVPKKKKCIEGKRKKITRKYQSASPVNQSRAEARERARERTKEKLNIKKLESRSVYYSDCCSLNSTLQSNFWNDIESDKIEESLIGKKISIPSSMLYSYQPNLDMSNDSSSSSSKFNSNSFPNFTVAYEQKGDITTI